MWIADAHRGDGKRFVVGRVSPLRAAGLAAVVLQTLKIKNFFGCR
jgi:hypothetical protein